MVEKAHWRFARPAVSGLSVGGGRFPARQNAAPGATFSGATFSK
jgi:hypothetical protein